MSTPLSSQEEIQKRFNLISSKYNELRGDIVLLILKRDGYIESGRNDQEVKKIESLFNNFKSMVVDMLK